MTTVWLYSRASDWRTICFRSHYFLGGDGGTIK